MFLIGCFLDIQHTLFPLTNSIHHCYIHYFRICNESIVIFSVVQIADFHHSKSDMKKLN
ncbi:unnamed protein product [Brugia timori]|uniref:Uncharacterized protein n=1 Tax=Brugia timori TaxID=42155 RepID=A0A0R3R1F9_9BILA|nr:unnamed protein product [Brugia timori]